MTSVHSSSLYGTLNLLILQTVAQGPHHGLAVARAIRGRTDGVLAVEEGALYPALHRLERDGLLKSDWGRSDTGRRAKFYELTARGRARLEKERELWLEHTRAVGQVLEVSWA